MIALLMIVSFAVMVAIIVLVVFSSDPAGRARTRRRGPVAGPSTPVASRLPTIAAPTASGLSRVAPGQDHTLNAGGLAILFAKRTSGAVWSMKWKGHELVQPLEGNGGSLQSACSYDTADGEDSNEVENPTEAGNVKDARGATSSKWLSAARSASEMYTRAQMAYFIPPGMVVPSSPHGTRARGSGVLSDTVLTKRVTVGHRGYPNVIRYVIQFECPSPHWFAQYEVLTGYMPRDFGTIYTVVNGRPVRMSGPVYDPGISTAPVPVIAAKSDSVALGIVADACPPVGRFPNSPWYIVDCQTHGGAVVGNPRQAVPLTKWSVVWQVGGNMGTRIPTQAAFGICLVVGSVSQVASTLGALAR